MDGLQWKTLLKWIIWGYHYFWKHPCKISDLLQLLQSVDFPNRKGHLEDPFAAFYIASSVTDIYIYICDVLVLKFGGPTILIDVDPLPSF